MGKGALCFLGLCGSKIHVLFHTGMSLGNSVCYSSNEGLSPVANPMMNRTNGGSEQNPAEPANTISS